ncbi:MAG: hypothetical protein HGA87_03260 [Desulfobulbaceae bacterium]|nr:hypothetical protein [Desulfobulbaceae bacterium]
MLGDASTAETVLEMTRMLIDAIAWHKPTEAELSLFTKRCRQTEFTGTAYMPLPTESDIVKVMQAVQQENKVKREHIEETKSQLQEDGGEITEGEFAGKTVDELLKIAIDRFFVNKKATNK